MNTDNIIKIAGVITEKPHMILDANDFDKRVFETKIAATRRSGTEDVLILQFSGKAAGGEDQLEKLDEGQAIKVTGSICTANEREIVPTAPSVKIYIEAESVAIVDEITEPLNEVKICGNICKDPRIRTTPKGTRVADIMVAVHGKKNANFIPCICWQDVADATAENVKKGTYVEIEGRFQSREYKKKIDGSTPFLMTAYEVSVVQLGAALEDTNEE